MRYLAVIIGIFGLELGIKNHVEETLEEGEKRPVCKGAFLVRKYHNRGAFLNVGEKRRKVVAVMSALLSLILTALFIASFTAMGSGLLKWGLTVMLGGAYSNTYDRLKRKYVVDYVSFNVPFQRLRQVVFNLGDFCIMIGAMLSVLSEICKK